MIPWLWDNFDEGGLTYMSRIKLAIRVAASVARFKQVRLNEMGMLPNPTENVK